MGLEKKFAGLERSLDRSWTDGWKDGICRNERRKGERLGGSFERSLKIFWDDVGKI